MEDEKKPSIIDDSFDVVDAPLEEGKTPEDTTKAEGTVELTPEEKLFAEKGLDKQYAGGISEMIERMPDTNKYVTDLEKERNYLRDQLKGQGQEVPVDPDFDYDPKAYVDSQIGKRDTVLRQDLEDFKVKTFMDSKEDFQRLLPQMEDKLKKLPGLAKLNPSEAVEILYQTAKAEQMSQAIEKAKADSPAPDKDLAETDVLGIARKKGEKSPEDYGRMSLAELEKEFGVTDE